MTNEVPSSKTPILARSTAPTTSTPLANSTGANDAVPSSETRGESPSPSPSNSPSPTPSNLPTPEAVVAADGGSEALISPVNPAESTPPAGIRAAVSSQDEGTAYDTNFWYCYAANMLLVMSASLLFRYGDFVRLLGGDELDLGFIVGAGAIGSLASRLTLGAGIDSRGPGRIWLFSLVGIFVALLAHTMLGTVHGPAVYIVRILYQTSLAGAFGASVTYTSLRAPSSRMAEVVGMLGSSGFLGIALGSLLSDFLCRANVIELQHLHSVFYASAVLVAVSFVCAWIATRDFVSARSVRNRPPILWLVRRYHPGSLALMSIMMGLALGLPGSFVRPFTASLGIAQIGVFFAGYAIAAFTTRIAARRLPNILGVRLTASMGMAALVSGLLLYLPVQASWQLALPGIAAGVGHALIFPAIISGGSQVFPLRYRGLGVTLMLGFFDLGTLVGMPLAGSLVRMAEAMGLPKWETMWLVIAILLTATTIAFWCWPIAKPHHGMRRDAAKI